MPNYHGVKINSDIEFQIVYPPTMIPITPNPIASNKKFFFSGIFTIFSC